MSVRALHGELCLVRYDAFCSTLIGANTQRHTERHTEEGEGRESKQTETSAHMAQPRQTKQLSIPWEPQRQQERERENKKKPGKPTPESQAPSVDGGNSPLPLSRA